MSRLGEHPVLGSAEKRHTTYLIGQQRETRELDRVCGSEPPRDPTAATRHAQPDSLMGLPIIFGTTPERPPRAAVGDIDTDSALQLWGRLREEADDELESGKRGAKVAGDNGNPYTLAQYLAIRDSFFC